MVTVITAAGSPLVMPLAHDAVVQDGRLICINAAGERLISFDALDVKAYAVERPGVVPEWVMGGPSLLTPPRVSERQLWWLPARLRLSYR